MIDMDTFITTLYVMVDDFCQSQKMIETHHGGTEASLSQSEVVTLALLGQWANVPSERARYAQRHLLAAFPDLPHRSQFNRRLRSHRDAITAFGLYLVALMDAQDCCYEVLDSTAALTRDAKRRGTGWLAGQADIGWRNRLGWYEGFHLLLRVTPLGVITGFGFGFARTSDQHLPRRCLRHEACPSLLCPVRDGLPKAAMWPIKALLERSLISGGENNGKRKWSWLLIKEASNFAGPKSCGASWLIFER